MKLQAAVALLCIFLSAHLSGCSAKSSAYGYYRFDDNFANAVSVDGPALKKENTGQLLGLDGWTTQSPGAKVEQTPSSVVLTSEAVGLMASPTQQNIQGTAIDTINLTMSATGTDKVHLRWIPQGLSMEELYVFTVKVPRQGEMVQYSLQMANMRTWRYDRIDQILFEVPQAARLEIQSIELVNRRAAFNGAAAGVVHYSVEDRVRPCLFNHCPATVKYHLRLPERAFFRAGLAVVESNTPVEFQLFVKPRGAGRTVFTKTIQDSSCWNDVEIDLSEYAGKDVELSLISLASGAGQVALWSNPAVFERYEKEAKPPRPNVVLYIIDCLRADHLDAYGYDRKTAPNLAAFAAEAVKFERCFSTDTWTKTSMPSLATGVDNGHHGIQDLGDVLPRDLTTFPELLRRAGYETCVLTANPHTPPETIPRASYSYLEAIHLRLEAGGNLVSWDLVPQAISEDLTLFLRRHSEQPFFLYVHTMELHDRRMGGLDSQEFIYDPPEDYRSLFTSPGGPTTKDLYDGAISFADANFKKMLNRLDQLGLRENTIVIVTADHGEGLMEHDGVRAHAHKPYNNLTHVPLLIQWAGRAPAHVVKNNVALLDLAPTILQMTGLQPCGQFQGMSLMPLLEGQPVPDDRAIISKWFHDYGMVQGDFKMMWRKKDGARLYDLKTDFGETTDVAAKYPEVVEKMKTALQAHIDQQKQRHESLSKPASGPGVKVDSQLEDQLRALGYVE